MLISDVIEKTRGMHISLTAIYFDETGYSSVLSV
jgi:hypothetical protein